MNVMTVLERIKSGERVMVTLSQRAQKPLYNLTDGTEVPSDQFEKIKPFITAADAGLFEGGTAQCYEWAK